MNAYLLFTLIALGCGAIFAGVAAVAKPDDIAAALRRIATALESIKKHEPETHKRDLMGIEVLQDIKTLLDKLVVRAEGSQSPTYSAHSGTPIPGPVLWEICYLHDRQWHHSGWVREGTDTYHKTFATPGLALRQGDHIEEGVQ